MDQECTQMSSERMFFSPFMRKKVEKAPKLGTLGCFKKENKQTNKNNLKKLTDRPKYSELSLESNTMLLLLLCFFFLHNLGAQFYIYLHTVKHLQRF